jgi:hypothetical protein
MNLLDEWIRATAGPEPTFDPVLRDFLDNSASELRQRLRPGSLLEAVNLGARAPWLWRLTFHTKGLARDESGRVVPADRHTVMVRFLPDYLRRAERFETLLLVEPHRPFHPNLRDRHICLEVYPGEPLVEMCESLHRLFSWRLRQLAETDALDPEACAWGRAHVDELPIDKRPLFGRTLNITLDPVEQPA